MLYLNNRRKYLVDCHEQYQKLYAGDDLYHWALTGIPLFRAQDWQIVPLAGDPWRATRMLAEGASEWNEHCQLNPDESVEAPYRYHMYSQYWRPWTSLLQERRVSRLIVSTCERISDDRTCCAQCGLDWEEIGKALSAIDYAIADCFALFSMSDEWAMYGWEGLAILGGRPDFMLRYGELAGGWERLRRDFTKHLAGDYDFCNHPKYRAAVERALSGPNVAWLQSGRSE